MIRYPNGTVLENGTVAVGGKVIITVKLSANVITKKYYSKNNKRTILQNDPNFIWNQNCLIYHSLNGLVFFKLDIKFYAL